MSVQARVWLPVFGILNVRTDVDASYCTRGGGGFSWCQSDQMENAAPTAAPPPPSTTTTTTMPTTTTTTTRDTYVARDGRQMLQRNLKLHVTVASGDDVTCP